LSGFFDTAITVIEAAVDNLLPPILFSSRSIGGFVANVTIEEDHNDEIEISDHPVEQGSEISDNAYKRPPSVTITAGWSNSSLSALGNPYYTQQIYDALLNLQASLEPFQIVTGKRIYENMMMRRLSAKTDEKTENSLIVIAECRNVQIVSTQTVSSGSGDPKNMRDPVNNAGVTNTGTNSAIERGPDLANLSTSPTF
jgi:hypothetical protein